MIHRLLLTGIAMLMLISVSAQKQLLPYQDKTQPVDVRVNDLLGRMTLEEKFWQLYMLPVPVDITDQELSRYRHGVFGFQVSAAAQQGGAHQQMLTYQSAENALTLTRRINAMQKFFVTQTRLGIPMIPFDEALHGLVREGATAFPQAIALAATFDTTLMSRVADVIATETRARGIRQVLSPVVNVATDVRWGRTEETYGEDPFLVTAMGTTYVSKLEQQNIITTPKHFVANVGAGGRDSYPIHDDERYLEEIHFPPFQACVLSGARSLMTSYNSVSGAPATSNYWLLTKKLKDDWGFDGFVISDAGATGGSVVLHHTASDYPDATHQAINAGLDVIFQTAFDHHALFLPAFVDGRVDRARLDDAVARVLRAKFELGLFENPYVLEKEIQALMKSKEHKAVALHAARESMVLLKNSENVLPLTPGKTVAVIGVDAEEARLGGYSGPGNGVVSILDGIRQVSGADGVVFARGPGRTIRHWTVIPGDAVMHNGQSGWRAEYFNTLSPQGQSTAIRNDQAIDFHWTFMPPVENVSTSFYSVRWTGTLTSPVTGQYQIALEGNDGFRLYINNELKIDRWRKQSYGVYACAMNLKQGQRYDLRIEFNEPTGNGQVRLLWNIDSQADAAQAAIDTAVETAKKADYSVIVAGIEEGEFRDRALLSLPGEQEKLIKAVAAVGKPVVVVLVGGSAVVMENWLDQVDGVMMAWYPGEEGGRAVAEVLYGLYSPAGRLPVTFPKHEGQLPLVYYHKPTGRGDDYDNLTGLPQFPFGYGLSYTSFSYDNLRVSLADAGSNDVAIVQCTVANTGTREGDEVVQLYVQDVLASVARPLLALKGFTRIHLKPGESKEVSFTIPRSMLEMLDGQMKRVVEPGTFKIMIGSSSRDIRLQALLEVK
jgi:beta-glucosidase